MTERRPKRKGAKESTVAKKCLLMANKMGARLKRNSGGKAMLPSGMIITIGFGKGSSDYIGWKSVTITPEMVGRRVAIFTAMETKREKGGKRSGAQEDFIRLINSVGGIAFFAKNEDDVRKALEDNNA